MEETLFVPGVMTGLQLLFLGFNHDFRIRPALRCRVSKRYLSYDQITGMQGRSVSRRLKSLLLKQLLFLGKDGGVWQ